MDADAEAPSGSVHSNDRIDMHSEIIQYWDERSRGYSLATRMSLNQKDDRIRRFLKDSIPENHRLRVIDMGTGAGYMAILFAQMGHDVIAVDDSAEMLERARANARLFRVDVQFIKADVEKLDLPQYSFDVVVAKDTVWTLKDPMIAYLDWACLIRPGGYMLIIDGNYYLDLFDEDYAKRRRYLDLKYGADNNLHAKTNMDGVDLTRIRNIAANLPMSRERRPSWDLSAMLGIGMVDIRVKSLDSNSYTALTKDGMVKLPVQFAIVSQAPYAVEDVRGADRHVEDSMLEHVAEHVASTEESGCSILKALADERRMRIVLALREGSMSVGQISKVVGDSQSLVSHNLKLLKESNVVRSTRGGKVVYYNLTDRHALDSILNICGAMRCVR